MRGTSCCLQCCFFYFTASRRNACYKKNSTALNEVPAESRNQTGHETNHKLPKASAVFSRKTKDVFRNVIIGMIFVRCLCRHVQCKQSRKPEKKCQIHLWKLKKHFDGLKAHLSYRSELTLLCNLQLFRSILKVALVYLDDSRSNLKHIPNQILEIEYGC